MTINITARDSFSWNGRQINGYGSKLYSWLSNGSTGTMVEMDLSGNITNANLFTMTGATWFPFVIDESGNFYVSYNGTAVYKYSNSGTFISNIATINGYVGCADLINNRLFFYNYISGVVGYISDFKTSPSVVSSWKSVGGYLIDGFCTNNSGDLVIGYNTGSLIKYTVPAGAASTILSGVGECRQPAYDSVNDSYYISNYGSGWVRKYSSAGTLIDSTSPSIKSMGTAFFDGYLYALLWNPGVTSTIYSNRPSSSTNNFMPFFLAHHG